MYYFLEEDLKDIDDQINIIKERLARIQKEIGDSCRQSSETWHDNFGFEEGMRQQNMWIKQLSDLLEIRSGARIIVHNNINNTICVGCLVEFKDMETGEIEVYRISSYMILKNRHGFISYESPLAKILMGGTAGEERKGSIAGREKTFKILKVV